MCMHARLFKQHFDRNLRRKNKRGILMDVEPDPSMCRATLGALLASGMRQNFQGCCCKGCAPHL